MSDSADRLAKTRLAIIEEVRRRKEGKGSLRDKVRDLAAMAGFGRPAQRPPAQASQSAGTTAALPPQSPVPEKAPSAQERVARSPAQPPAEAAAAQVRAAAADREEAQAEAHPHLPGNDPAARKQRRAQRLFSGRFAGLGEAGRDYWKHHPAHLAIELATPTLSAYAQRRPVSYLAIAAGVGAIIYLTRPWRLLSVSSLAIAALRSPQVSSALISAIWGKGGDTPDN